MDQNPPNRAERRRQDKEAKKGKKPNECGECDEGPCTIAPRTFDACPVCGCPARFVIEAMKGDLHLQDIFGRQPALFADEYVYDTPTQIIRLISVGASCVRCGALYTIARDKLAGVPIALPNQPGPGGLILPGN